MKLSNFSRQIAKSDNNKSLVELANVLSRKPVQKGCCVFVADYANNIFCINTSDSNIHLTQFSDRVFLPLGQTPKNEKEFIEYK